MKVATLATPEQPITCKRLAYLLAVLTLDDEAYQMLVEQIRLERERGRC